jgi:hypothetical protein
LDLPPVGRFATREFDCYVRRRVAIAGFAVAAATVTKRNNPIESAPRLAPPQLRTAAGERSLAQLGRWDRRLLQGELAPRHVVPRVELEPDVLPVGDLLEPEPLEQALARGVR